MIDGQDLAEVPLTHLRSKLALVPQVHAILTSNLWLDLLSSDVVANHGTLLKSVLVLLVVFLILSPSQDMPERSLQL